MPYEDNLFLRMSPAGIIARVTASDPSLAIVSALPISEQIRIGWIGNPAVERLYELTSAGVWSARTNASGNLTEANSSNINTYTNYNARHLIGSHPATIKAGSISWGSDTEAGYCHRRIGVLGKTIVSNAGGTLDADVDVVAALAGYYGVVSLKHIKASQIVAAGATLVFHDGTGNVIYTLTLAAFVANVPQDLGELKIFIPALTDNSKITIDVTSHDLGNATTFDLDYEYWWET